MNIGKAIKLCRTQKDLSQGELAKKAGISTSYLSLIERGKRDPQLSTLESIAQSLDIPLSILIYLGADPNELTGLDDELIANITHSALHLMKS